MPRKFHNPYHFVPLARPKPGDRRITRSEFAGPAPGHWVHDRYFTDDGSGLPVRSGRIVCSLTTVSAAFVGGSVRTDGSREDRKPAQHEAFLVDGLPTIPESTLKGMISSIAEVASRSAARVFSNRRMSFRRQTTGNESTGALSALGMVIRAGDDYHLLPLTLPTLVAVGAADFDVPEEYRPLFPQPRFRVYLNGYKGNTDEAIGDLTNKVSFTAETPTYYFMNLPAVRYAKNSHMLLGEDESHLKVKLVVDKQGTRRHFALSQEPANGSNSLLHTRSPGSVCGIVRILGRHGMRPKKHELFIPVPKNLDEILAGTATAGLVPIVPVALERLQDLAGTRHEETEHEMPYLPVGYPERTSFEPQHGEVVYFRPSKNGKSVVEIAYSSIWRGRVETSAGQPETTWDFIDPEQRPMHKDRTSISPAELVFGFVEGSMGAPAADPALAQRSRVDFSCATLDGGQDDLFEPSVTLKLLNSPKLPVPAFRFRLRKHPDNNLIPKSHLNPQLHEPQGFVTYLHDPKAIEAEPGAVDPPWKTGRSLRDSEFRPDLHVRITPMRKGLTFHFHVDFTNLDEYELGMLLHALEPDPTFHHKLGMGKPIGLGSVKLTVEGVFTVDRAARYRDEDLFERERYHSSWLQDGQASTAAQDEIDRGISATEPINVATIRGGFAATVDAQTQHSLRVLGDPGLVTHAVHYPHLADSDGESKLFQWFVANENGLKEEFPGTRRISRKGRALGPIRNNVIPPLEEYEWE